MAIDFGASLDKILGAYTKVTEVRTQANIAKWQAAGQVQNATLNAPEGYNPREAYSIGNAANPAMQNGVASGGGGAMSSIPPPVLYGGLALAGVALLLLARR